MAVHGSFEQFMETTEPKIRRALIAGYGSRLGRDATLDDFEYAWEHWERVRSGPNPAGYVYRTGLIALREPGAAMAAGSASSRHPHGKNRGSSRSWTAPWTGSVAVEGGDMASAWLLWDGIGSVHISAIEGRIPQDGDPKKTPERDLVTVYGSAVRVCDAATGETTIRGFHGSVLAESGDSGDLVTFTSGGAALVAAVPLHIHVDTWIPREGIAPTLPATTTAKLGPPSGWRSLNQGPR